jgi:hypothetical protein
MRRASRSPTPRWLPLTSNPLTSTATGTTLSLLGAQTGDAVTQAQALRPETDLATLLGVQVKLRMGCESQPGAIGARCAARLRTDWARSSWSTRPDALISAVVGPSAGVAPAAVIKAVISSCQLHHKPLIEHHYRAQRGGGSL